MAKRLGRIHQLLKHLHEHGWDRVSLGELYMAQFLRGFEYEPVNDEYTRRYPEDAREPMHSTSLFSGHVTKMAQRGSIKRVWTSTGWKYLTKFYPGANHED